MDLGKTNIFFQRAFPYIHVKCALHANDEWLNNIFQLEATFTVNQLFPNDYKDQYLPIHNRIMFHRIHLL